MKNKIIIAILLASSTSLAQEECSECNSPNVCLSAEEFKLVKKAIVELDEIKSSKAEITIEDEIIIIRDWQDRIYINGGQNKPLQAKLKIGDTIDRDLEIILPIEVGYREKPPTKTFRLRLKAQLGILALETIDTISGDEINPFWDAGLAYDFLKFDFLKAEFINLNLYTGIRSAGGGVGFDLTKNFGTYLGYSFVYESVTSSLLIGTYFSFN